MRVGMAITHQGTTYTVESIGPMGSGKFHGRCLITLVAPDGSRWEALIRSGKLAWNARLSGVRA